jgi:hypothetical protein
MRKKQTVPLWLSLLLPIIFSLASFTNGFSQLSAGIYSMNVTKDMFPQNTSEEHLKALVGKWEWTLTEDGSMKLTLDGKVKVEGKYSSTSEEVKITDEKGEIACSNNPGSETGTYKWMLENNKLTLTVVEDKCEGRKNFLTHGSWRKEK